jgi:hypothetical protein
VRNRTVVGDRRDTAFVIFSVVVGMAIGAGHLEVALAGMGVVGIAALVVQPRGDGAGLNPHWRLTVRVGIGLDAGALLEGVFREHLGESHLAFDEHGQAGRGLGPDVQGPATPGQRAHGACGRDEPRRGVQSVELQRL